MSNGRFWSSVWNYFNGAPASAGWAGNAFSDIGFDDRFPGNPDLGDLLGADFWGAAAHAARGSQQGRRTVAQPVAQAAVHRPVAGSNPPLSASPKSQQSKGRSRLLGSLRLPVSRFFQAGIVVGAISCAAPTQAAAPVTTLPDGSTLVGSSGGLEFHLVWDSSVQAAPAAFKQAVEAAAGFYTQMYSNAEVINIAVGWGEVDGMPISAGDLAEGVRPGEYLTYSQVLSGLNNGAGHSSGQAQADSTLPSTDPLVAKYYYVPFAEAKALGYIPPISTEIDGYIGISKTVALSYTQPVAAGQFDAIGAMEHEISAVMGRVGAVGAVYGSGLYTPLDLFRYSAPGVRATSAGAKTPYFSINGGVANLGNYSTTTDFGDWNYSSVRGDAYGGATSGTTLIITPNDLIEIAVLGYNLTAAGLVTAKLSA